MNTDKYDNNQKYVTDVVDFNTQIMPYPVTFLIGGCGCGKNVWIDNIVEGNIPDIPKQKVALITSRASKRKETLSNDSYAGNVNFDGNVFIDDVFSFIILKRYGLVVEEYAQYMTQSGKLIKDACIIPIQVDSTLIDAGFLDQDSLDGALDIFWDQFDLLIVDEVHSLLLDSGFMISQARIGELIKRFVKSCMDNNKHMILMTATSDGIKPILKRWIPGLHILDVTKKTFCVMPKSVRITPKEQVKREHELLYRSGAKFIYFYNGKAMYLSNYCDGTVLDEEFGVSLFSDPVMRDWLRDHEPEEFKKMIDVEEYLAKNQCFPDWVKFVISTSRNREGISIKNKDFQHMYVDSHIPTEVVQYTGRLRAAEFTLTIVDGSYQYFGGSKESIQALQNHDKECLDELNDGFIKYDDEKYRRYIINRTETEKMIVGSMTKDNPDYHPYIFFNPFSFKFEFNELKAEGEKYIRSMLFKWLNIDRRKKTSFYYYIKSWFSKPVEVQYYETKEWQSLEILRTNGIIVNSSSVTTKRYYTDNKINAIKSALTPLWGKFSRINTYLARFDDSIQFRKIESGIHRGQWELIKKPKK